jgi:hypothetical protein
MRARASVLATTFLVGLLASGWAFYHLYRNWKLTDNAVRTTATVMYLDTPLYHIRGPISSWHRVNEYSDDCYETVVFQTKGGDEIVWQSSISVDMPDWFRGQSVYEEHAATILYDPADPDYWEYDKVMSMFVNWFALLLGGLALMSLSFGPYDLIMNLLRESDTERLEKLAPIREELYAPIEPQNRPDRNEEKTTGPETVFRTAPAGVDENEPMAFGDPAADAPSYPDYNPSGEPAYAKYGTTTFEDNSTADGFDNDEDPFSEMR